MGCGSGKVLAIRREVFGPGGESPIGSFWLSTRRFVSDQSTLPLPVRALRLSTRALRSPIPVIALAAVTLVLGYWGYSEIPGEQLSAGDKLYKTVQLAGVEGEIPESGTPWQLDIARFTAPLILPYAALVALFALLAGRAQRLRLRLFARRHVLVIGAGERGARLARALRATHDVVVMDIDGSSGAAISLRKSGLPVVIGDARDAAILRTAQPQRASDVVLLSGDDSVNLEILARLRGEIDPANPVATHVAIDAPTLWAELHRLPLQEQSSQRRVEFVSIPDRVARRLTDSAFAGRHSPQDDRRVLIRGAGPTVARLVVQVLRSPVIGARPQIVLEGPDVAENLQILRASDDWVFEHAQVSGADGSETGREATLAFVCGLGEAQALEAAIILTHRLPAQAPVHVAVPDAGTEAALRETGADLRRMRLVSTTSRVLSEELLQEAAFERIARARHEEFLRGEVARGASPGEKDSIRDWDDLAEPHRIANRRYADGIARALDDIGARVVPLTGSREGSLPLSAGVLEYLAIREHNRWWQDKCRDGEVYGPDHRSGHPSMRPWDELGEDDRDRDNESIRILPAVLADVGYEIVAPEPEEIERRVAAARAEDDPRKWRPDNPDCSPAAA